MRIIVELNIMDVYHDDLLLSIIFYSRKVGNILNKHLVGVINKLLLKNKCSKNVKFNFW